MVDKKIKNISDKEKLDYLNELLNSDEEFKSKFIKYFEVKEKMEEIYKNEDLKSLVNEIYDLLNGADVELYTEDCRGGYYDYYEDDISNELCEDLFLEIEKQIKNHLQQNEFYQALFILCAIGKAIDLSPTIDDEYCLIYDYEEVLSEYHFYLITQYIDIIKKSDISFENKKELILFLVDNSNDSDELKNFERLLDILIADKQMAIFLTPYIPKFHINIQLKILNLLEDDKVYIDTARQFYKKDKLVAKKLLEKLYLISTYEEYEEIAKECFNKDNNYFVSDIFKVITYEKSKKFYLKLLAYKVLNHQNLKEYIKYKKYIDEKEIKNIQNKLCNNWRYEYCIKVLKYEKKYDKILHLAQSKNYIDLNIVLTPIKNHYPKECLKIIIDKCNELLNGFGKNRDRYKQMCNLLLIMVKVSTVKDDIDLYIKTIVNRKPRLPALIDELSKARLI
jgi:hypothetical protein